MFTKVGTWMDKYTVELTWTLTGVTLMSLMVSIYAMFKGLI